MGDTLRAHHKNSEPKERIQCFQIMGEIRIYNKVNGALFSIDAFNSKAELKSKIEEWNINFDDIEIGVIFD